MTYFTGLPYIFYFPAIVIVGVLAGARWGIAALAASVLLAWYVFIAPAFSFEIAASSDVIGLVVFSLSGSVVLVFPLLLRASLDQLQASETRYRQLASKLALAQERQEILNAELRHRLKNLMAVMGGIANQSRRKDDPAINAFLDQFLGRVYAILRTGEAVLATSSRQPPLGEVAQLALAPFLGAEGKGPILITGPRVTLSEQTAGSLALAFHELATNSLKYGALSAKDGEAGLTWSIGDDGRLCIEWKERGGPPPQPPTREGFGTRVIRMAVAREGNGQVETMFEPDGLRCKISYELRAANAD